MPQYKPEIHDLESLMRYFDDSGYYHFSVFAGFKEDEKFRRYSYDGEDPNLARELLENAGQAILSNPDNTNVYTLVLYKMKGKIRESKQAICFQLNRRDFIPMVNNQNNYNPQLMHVISSLESKLAAIEMKLADDEEDEEIEDPEENNFLNGIMKNPQIQSLIMAGISNLFKPNGTKVTNLAGVIDENENKLEKALEILSQYDDQLENDLYLLAMLAEKDPMQFNFLIKMLRK